MIRRGTDVNEILANYTQEQLWADCLGFFPGDKRFCNPFRSDKKPDCYLKWTGSRIRMYDWADDRYNGIDVFEAFRLKFGYTYIRDVINHIARRDQKSPKRNDESVKREIVLGRTEHKIEVRSRVYQKYPKKYIDYWLQYGIDEALLREFNVYAIEEAWINTRNNPRLRPLRVDSITFSLYFPSSDHQKLYSPHEDRMKWFGNTNKEDVYGLDQLKGGSRRLFVTSSLKDLLVITMIARKYNIPIECIAPNGEGYLISGDVFGQVCEMYDPKEWVLWYDLDKAGLKYAFKHSKVYGCNYTHNPYSVYPLKDPSDLIKERKDGETIIKSILESYV